MFVIMLALRLCVAALLFCLFSDAEMGTDMVKDRVDFGGLVATWLVVEFFYRGLKRGFVTKGDRDFGPTHEDLHEPISGGYLFCDSHDK